MSESIEHIRKKAIAITARINSDAAFKAQVKNDPEGSLLAAGLPGDVVPDFLVEGRFSDTSGYMIDRCTITCIITSCDVMTLG
jgi:hypothetical protein